MVYIMRRPHSTSLNYVQTRPRLSGPTCKCGLAGGVEQDSKSRETIREPEPEPEPDGSRQKEKGRVQIN